MNNTAYIPVDILILTWGFIGFLTSAGILFSIIYHRQQFPINAPTLLICNSFCSIILPCIILLNMYAYKLYGSLHSNISFDNWWCYGRAYLLHVGLCLLYHSFLLQAFFRFLRVVLFRYKQLQTFRFIYRLAISQWLIDFLLIIPILILREFQYISQNYYCQILFTNIRGLVFATFIVFNVSMTGIGSIYFYIIYYTKKTNGQLPLQNRQRANQRDLVVLRRIIILVGILLTLGLPSILLWLSYLITGYLYPFIYDCQWLSYALSLSVLPTTMIYSTPQLREFLANRFRRNRRIQPTVIIHEYGVT